MAASLVIFAKETRVFFYTKASSYCRSPKKIVEALSMILLWILWAYNYLEHHDYYSGSLYRDESLLAARFFKGLAIVVMLINLLMYLSSFTIIGATIDMIRQVAQDFSPIFLVMVLLTIAFTFAMRVILYTQFRDDMEYDRESIFEHEEFLFLNGLKVAYSFGFLGEFTEDLQSSAPKGFERNVISAYSDVAFYTYSLISNVVLLNLLIAIIGDSYNHVKGNEAVARGIQRARTLCDIDRVWGSYLTGIDSIEALPDEFYPKCLHVLARRETFGQNAGLEKTTWEGKMQNTLSSVSENLKGVIEEQNDQLARRVEGRLKQIESNINDRFAAFEVRFQAILQQDERGERKSVGVDNSQCKFASFVSVANKTPPAGPPSRVLDNAVFKKMKAKGKAKIGMRQESYGVVAKIKKITKHGS